jgi:sn-glycerol 3-phosphate transport system permease protein
MSKFNHQKLYAWLFIVPQLLVTFIFFIWPACSALKQAFFYTDPFGLHQHFARLANFADLLHDPSYSKALFVSFVMSLSITLLTMTLGLTVALLINNRTKSQGLYKSLLIWPYAIAPAVAGILWRFLCHPTLGWITHWCNYWGINFDYVNNAHQALLVVILTASWQQFSYNFLFYFASIKALPRELMDAATIDGASSWQRFRHIILPLLSPTTFFLLLINLIYGFFDTFGIIQVMTHGGPGNSTTNLIYKVYEDGFEGMDLGSSAAQSVFLMIIVIIISLIQFKYLERKVHYE